MSHRDAIVRDLIDRIRRNDKSLQVVEFIDRGEGLQILDALRQNSVVKSVIFLLPPLNEEMLVKLSEVMEYNKSLDNLEVYLESGLITIPPNPSRIVRFAGLAPALRRLKEIGFLGADLTLQQIGELWEGAPDCTSLEKFSFGNSKSIDVFKAICQLCSRFPSLKCVSQLYPGTFGEQVAQYPAVLKMVKTSKTIEHTIRSYESFRQIFDVEDGATIRYHCHKNKIHNQFALVHQKGLLAAKVPNSAWPLILKKFSDMPDVLYYLLQQKHGAMFAPSHHGRKRKQDFN
jgi:hypothetical protein